MASSTRCLKRWMTGLGVAGFQAVVPALFAGGAAPTHEGEVHFRALRCSSPDLSARHRVRCSTRRPALPTPRDDAPPRAFDGDGDAVA